MVVFGTRPEVIKMAPIIREMVSHSDIDPIIVSTGQHREMLDQMTRDLGIHVHHDLALMRDRQDLGDLTASAIQGVGRLIRETTPDIVLVQGDTSTAFAAALAAFYSKTRVAHVEAGLRSGDAADPYPEEVNRRLVADLASVHFAPTIGASQNLRDEGVGQESIFVTGNTVIDNLFWVLGQKGGTSAFRANDKLKILVTLHRRENQGPTMAGIGRCLRDVAEREDVEIVLPLHMSPAVREALVPALGNSRNVRLVEPLDYRDFTRTLNDCDLVVTDSGGVQEEAPSLGKPVLVVRDTTERPEGVAAGTALLVGTDPAVLAGRLTELLESPSLRSSIAQRVNPYGDGTAARRIVQILRLSYFATHETAA